MSRTKLIFCWHRAPMLAVAVVAIADLAVPEAAGTIVISTMLAHCFWSTISPLARVPTLMDYLGWNDQITAYFFKPEMNGRRVYLYVTNELIRKIGKAENVGLRDFITTIKSGPDWVSGGGICSRAEQCLVGRRHRRLAFPPYIAYLAFFALAAG